jgi:hypothetical protein
MKNFQNSLRLMIATGSLLGFFGGWVLLAHAGKPAQMDSPSPVVAPAPSINQPALTPNNRVPSRLQPLPSSRSQSVPRLRTGGSR